MDNIKELSKPVGFVGLRNIISLAEGNLGVISPNAAFGEEPVYSQEYVDSLIAQLEAAKKEITYWCNLNARKNETIGQHELLEGWALVPTKPTAEMMAAAMECDDVVYDLYDDSIFHVRHDEIYIAMLAAAPQLAGFTVEGEER